MLSGYVTFLYLTYQAFNVLSLLMALVARTMDLIAVIEDRGYNELQVRVLRFKDSRVQGFEDSSRYNSFLIFYSTPGILGFYLILGKLFCRLQSLFND